MPKKLKGHILLSLEFIDSDKRKMLLTVKGYSLKEVDLALKELKKEDADPKNKIAVLLATDNINFIEKNIL